MIILNGGSSAGKSGIVRCLQSVLPEPWLAFGVDSLIEAMPLKMQSAEGGIEFDADGGVSIGPEFRALEGAWAEGVVAMARAGARIIIDDVFLGGAAAQERWRSFVGDLDVLWVGVRCDGPGLLRRGRGRDRILLLPAKHCKNAHIHSIAYSDGRDSVAIDGRNLATGNEAG